MEAFLLSRFFGAEVEQTVGVVGTTVTMEYAVENSSDTAKVIVLLVSNNSGGFLNLGGHACLAVDRLLCQELDERLEKRFTHVS